MRGCLSHAPYWGPGSKPGMSPDWESNWQPFGSQAGTQSTEPHQPGPVASFLYPGPFFGSQTCLEPSPALEALVRHSFHQTAELSGTMKQSCEEAEMRPQ